MLFIVVFDCYLTVNKDEYKTTTVTTSAAPFIVSQVVTGMMRPHTDDAQWRCHALGYTPSGDLRVIDVSIVAWCGGVPDA